MSSLTESKRIKAIFSDFDKDTPEHLEQAKKNIRAATKRELAQLLINPHQYVEANEIIFSSDSVYYFHNFILEALS